MHERNAAFQPLRDLGSVYVPGEGVVDGTARVMFVGEAPGANEDRLERPFVGLAGKRLDEWLVSAGLKRDEVYITNVVKYRPPGNRTPTPVEIHAARPALSFEIDCVNPNLVVLLGAVAGRAVAFRSHLETTHGQVLHTPKRDYLFTYHPSITLARRPELDEVARDDLRKTIWRYR